MSENKTGKYLKYAFGEIILVVIGILIALQINNWNENRKNRVTETEYLIRLEEETKWNIEQLTYNASQYLLTSRDLNKAIAYIEYGTYDSIINNFSRPNYIHPWIVKSSTYNELVSTGDLKIIQDVHLRDLLDEANSYAYFAQQQLENWRELAIAHEPYFVPYKRNILHKDSENKDYYDSAMDLDGMKNNSTIMELLKYWSGGNLVFYEGTNGLIAHYKKILARIECVKQNNDCPSISKSIIKN